MKPTNIKLGDGGYLALITSITISFLLLIISTTQNHAGWSLSNIVVLRESKEQSLYFAKDCTKYVIEKLITNNAFTGNSTTTIQNGFCYVLPILKNTPTNSKITVRVTTSHKNSYTNLESIVDMNDINFNTSPLSVTQQNPPTKNLEYKIEHSKEVSVHN